MKQEYLTKTGGLTLKRNFGWTLVANVIYAGSQWAMIVALARIGTSKMVGEFALALAFVTPILALTNMQLRSIQATDAANRYEFSEYLGLRVIGIVVGGIITLLAAIMAGYEQWALGAIMAMCLAKSAENLSDVLFGLQQQHERMDSVAISKIIRGPLALAMLVLTVWITGNVIWAIVAIGIARLSVYLIVDRPVARERLRELAKHQPGKHLGRVGSLSPSFSRKRLLKLGGLAFPMGVVTMLITLNTSIPRLVLERNVDVNALGIYSAIAALMAIGDQVNLALGQSASPRLARYFASRDIRKYKILITKLMGIGLLVGLMGLLLSGTVGAEVLAFIYSDEYAKYGQVFVVITLAGICSYLSTYLGYGLTAIRRFWAQAGIALTTVFVTTIASLILIPSFGMIGAGWTMCICFGVQLVLKATLIVREVFRNGNLVGE